MKSDTGKPTAELHHWRAQQVDHIEEYILWGNVHSDTRERWVDGYFIHTSGISKAQHPPDELKAGDIVKTRNSTYRLGEPYEND